MTEYQKLHLADRILEWQEKRRLEIAKHTEEWKKTGADFKQKRQALNIYLRTLRDMIGISEKTIRRFEKGLPVKNRKIIVASYTTALDCVQAKRQVALLT